MIQHNMIFILTIKIASDTPHPRADQEELSNVRKVPWTMKGLVIDRAIICYKIDRPLFVLNQSEAKPKPK